MRTYTKYMATLAIALSCSTSWASPYIGTGEFFVEPGSWTVGDAGSTHQAWDDFLFSSGNEPDAGSNTNPAIATAPVVNVTNSGFVTSTQNFYSFTGNYTVGADIYNHGTAGTDGTHVIVQTAATNGGVNGYTTLPNSMQIVDLSGGSLTGGDNASALVEGELLAKGVVSSSFGNVNMEVAIWEFFLPGYTGDFEVTFNEEQHSSFDQLRVDSFIAASAMPTTSFSFQVLPEPGSMALALVGLIGVASTRRSRS